MMVQASNATFMHESFGTKQITRQGCQRILSSLQLERHLCIAECDWVGGWVRVCIWPGVGHGEGEMHSGRDTPDRCRHRASCGSRHHPPVAAPEAAPPPVADPAPLLRQAGRRAVPLT